MATRRLHGYSLIELLIVIVIAGLLSTLAVLQFSGNSDQARAERSLDQLAASIQLLCDQALLTGQVRGLRLTRNGYDFWSITDGQWRTLRPDQHPLARAWPDSFRSEIQINQRLISATEPSGPQLWCDALEPMMPFQITLQSGQQQWVRVWSGMQ